MAEDQSEKESAGAAPKKLTSEILSEQDAGDVPKTDESTEKHPAYESDDVGPVGEAAEAPLKVEAAEDLPTRGEAEEGSADESERGRSQAGIMGVFSNDASQRTSSSKSIPLRRATANGLIEELVRLEEELKKSAEEKVEARRQLHIAREQHGALSKYTKILAIVSTLLMICVIGQIFLVEYLLR
jgi:hypothetical protein